MKTNLNKANDCTILANELPRCGERFPVLKPRLAGMMASSLLSKSGIQKPKAMPLECVTQPVRAGVKRLAKIIAKWRAAVSFKVPVGYQDQTGSIMACSLPPRPTERAVQRLFPPSSLESLPQSRFRLLQFKMSL